jgi:sugar phosphate permease
VISIAIVKSDMVRAPYLSRKNLKNANWLTTIFLPNVSLFALRNPGSVRFESGFKFCSQVVWISITDGRLSFMRGIFKFIKSNLRWLLGGLLLTVFSSFGQTFFISQFSAQIRAAFELTDGQFGNIYMVGTLASAATLVVMGKALDRFSVASVSFFVILALALACLSMSLVSSVVMLLFVIYALRLFGQGMMTHTAQTAIGRWYSAERGRAISLTSMGHQVGEASLPSLVLVLVAAVGWRGTWQVFAAVLVVVALPAIVWLMSVEHKPIIDLSKISKTVSVRDWTRPEVLRDGAFWGLCLGVLAPAFIGTSVYFHQARIIETKGWTPEVFAASFLVLSSTSILFTLVGGWLVDRFNAKRLLPTFLLPLAAACLVLSFGREPWAIFLFMFLLGCSYGFSSAVFGTIWPETYGTKHLGAIRAIAVAAMVFASALGPGITGSCIDVGIGFDSQLVVMAGYCLAAAVGMAAVSRHLLARTAV